MMTTLALYAASAVLLAAAPVDPQYDPGSTGDTGSDPGAAAVAPGEDPASITQDRGDSSDADRTGPLARGRRPRVRDDSGMERAVADPGAVAPAPASSDGIDAFLFQQQAWTGP